MVVMLLASFVGTINKIIARDSLTVIFINFDEILSHWLFR